MAKTIRRILLFLLSVVRRIIGVGLIGTIVGFLTLFGLQFRHSEKLDRLLPVQWLHRLADPVLAEVLSWLDRPWPTPSPSFIPVGLALVAWMTKLAADALFGGGRRLVDRFLPARQVMDAGDVEAMRAESEHAREELLKHYREIEKALKTAKRKECTFLSLDVAGSTHMKSGASDADIAATFQAYEEMVRKILLDHGAWKQAWTPDGVMVCFLDPNLALTAAKSLLLSLKAFNEAENRLPVPFRVRCGLNVGEVAIFEDSKLEKIADHIIDVAGHMQKYATPDTLLLPEEVWDRFQDKTGFRPAEQVVDGHKTYEWSV